MVRAVALETTQDIISELGDAPFSLLVDDSCDNSMKEQMAIVIHYVDMHGCVIERFLAIEHVTDTTAQSIKAAIDAVFCRQGLSLTRLRGQGYDGAINMWGELNGLKTLMMNVNPPTFYVLCFAHQL